MLFYGEENKNDSNQVSSSDKDTSPGNGIALHSTHLFLLFNLHLFVEYFVCVWYWVEHKGI